MSNVECRMEEFYRFNIHEQLQKNLIPQRPRFTGGYGSDRRHSANRAFILTDTAADAGLQVYVWQLNLYCFADRSRDDIFFQAMALGEVEQNSLFHHLSASGGFCNRHSAFHRDATRTTQHATRNTQHA
jgi:hypothetical protein